MPLTDLDRQLLLIQRVGDVDADTGDPVSPFKPGSNGIILINSERLWEKYIGYSYLQPLGLGHRLFEAYYMRSAVELVIGVLESRVDFSAVGTAMRVSLNQRRARAERFIDTLSDRIQKLEDMLQMWSPPLIGMLTTTVPITPPVPGQLSSPGWPWRVNADDPRYSGSPYWGSWRRW
jgi:hypothetical protein